MLDACESVNSFGDLEWRDLAWEEYERLTTRARDEGTRVHNLIESALKGGTYADYPPHDWEIVDRAVREVKDLAPDGTSEQTFVSPLGYGGTIDYHSVKADGVVADFKTKEFDKEGAEKLRLWDNHYMQLAAYREMIKRPNARCFIIYLSTEFPGLAMRVEAPQAKLEEGWEQFLALLNVWKVFKKYDPSFQEAIMAEEKVIEVRYVNQPKPGKQWGSVKDFNDEYYWVEQNLLSRFAPNNSYKVKFESSDNGGKFVREVLEDGSPVSGGAKAGGGVPHSAPPSADPHRNEDIAVQAMFKTLAPSMISGDTPMGEVGHHCEQLLAEFAYAWRQYKDKQARPKIEKDKDPLEDELPPGWE